MLRRRNHLFRDFDNPEAVSDPFTNLPQVEPWLDL
jgi:hypothetical protein